MSLQNPAALLLLLPLAGIIIALYLLKMRRKEIRVPATFLWPAKTEEIRANALFQKLRFSWLLVLQLLAVSLLVVAYARPQSQQSGLTGKTTVLIIDSSASMQAEDVKPSRFEEAKRQAASAIRSAKPGDRVALLEAGPEPRVISPLSNDPAKALVALNDLEGTDAENDIGAALRLAASLIGSIDGSQMVLLSDGAFEPVTDFGRGKASVVFRRVGEYDDNLAISALGITSTAAGRQLFVGIKNHCAKAISGSLTLVADGKVFDSVRVEVPAKDQFGRTVPVNASTQVFEAKLEAPDALKSDNYAVTLADPNADLRVLLVSKGDPFVERALALDPRVSLDRSLTVPTKTDDYDIVVFDGVEERPVASRGLLVLGSAQGDGTVRVSGQIKNPPFVSSEKSPLLDGVDLRSTFIDRAQKLVAGPKATVLAESSEGPLLVTEDALSQRRIYLAFAPLDSDFPLQVGFPIFIANVLDHLSASNGPKAMVVRPGVPFAVRADREATLDRQPLPDPIGSAVIIRNVRKVGPHQLVVDGKARSLYSSLRSERESNIAPSDKVALGSGEVKETKNPVRFADFWRPIVLLVLLVLMGEWWLFARKS